MRDRLSAAGYLFLVFIRTTILVIYRVLSAAKMIIYIPLLCIHSSDHQTSSSPVQAERKKRRFHSSS